jgi:hypothetical protein
MSFHAVCDICGKDSNMGKAVFNHDAIQLEIENYKLEKYRVFINVNIQNEEDYQFLKGIKEKSDQELHQLSKRDDLELNAPEPHICVACQKALAKQVLEEGFVDPDKVYTPKMKVSLQHIIPPTIISTAGFMQADPMLEDWDEEFDEDFDYEDFEDEEDYDEDELE